MVDFAHVAEQQQRWRGDRRKFSVGDWDWAWETAPVLHETESGELGKAGVQIRCHLHVESTEHGASDRCRKHQRRPDRQCVNPEVGAEAIENRFEECERREPFR